MDRTDNWAVASSSTADPAGALLDGGCRGTSQQIAEEMFLFLEAEVTRSREMRTGTAITEYLLRYYRGLVRNPRFFTYHFSGKVERLVECYWRLTGRDDQSGPIRVLDVGCGPGSHSILLAWLGGEVIGIDIDPEAISVAADRARNIGRLTRFREAPRFIVGDAMKISELVSPPVDLLFTQQALAQLGDIPTFLRQAGEILRPGAMLLISEGNVSHPVNFARFVSRRGGGWKAYAELKIGHMIEMVEGAGFRVEELEAFGHLPPWFVGMSDRSYRLALRLQRSLGSRPAFTETGMTYLLVARRGE